MKPETRSDNSETGDITFKISSFIKAFSVVLDVVMAMAVAGIVMKFYDVTGGSFLFVFSAAMLTLLFLVQIGLSFFYVVTQIKLAFLGAFSSLALALGYLSIIFRYQDWWGWQVLYFIVIPVFLVTAILLAIFLSRRKKIKPKYRSFLIRNLLIPYSLLIVLGVLAFVVDEDAFLHRPKASEIPESTKGFFRPER